MPPKKKQKAKRKREESDDEEDVQLINPVIERATACMDLLLKLRQTTDKPIWRRLDKLLGRHEMLNHDTRIQAIVDMRDGDSYSVQEIYSIAEDVAMGFPHPFFRQLQELILLFEALGEATESLESAMNE